MNQFSSSESVLSVAPVSSLTTTSTTTNNSLPFDYYSRYQGSSAGNGVGGNSTYPPVGAMAVAAAAAAAHHQTGSLTTSTSYSTGHHHLHHPSPHHPQSYMDPGAYAGPHHPQPVSAYPQACSMEYFRKSHGTSLSRDESSTNVAAVTSSPYVSSIFNPRKYQQLDFNNNGHSNAEVVKREPDEPVSEQLSPSGEGECSQTNKQNRSHSTEGDNSENHHQQTIICSADSDDDEDYEDDDDDDENDQSSLTNLRTTPIYLSPNCILYSYIGTDTLGAINDHFQRSFTMWFQNVQGSGGKGSSACAEIGSSNNGEPFNSSTTVSSKNGSKFWSPQSYYSSYKDVQSQSIESGQLSNSNLDNRNNLEAENSPQARRTSVDQSKQSSPNQRQSPVTQLKSSTKQNSLSGSSSASPSSLRASQNHNSNPQSPNKSDSTSGQNKLTENNEITDPNSGALVPVGSSSSSTHEIYSHQSHNHQHFRSAQYHRRYERRKRRYLKRFQLMATPLIRRKLPISFWKFSAMFSCYYAGNTSYAGASYSVSPYAAMMSGQTGSDYYSPSIRVSSGSQGSSISHQNQQQIGSNSYEGSYGHYRSTADNQDHGLAENTSSVYGHHQQSYDNTTSSVVKNENECGQQVQHHQPHSTHHYRPPLSLSVSMTIGGAGSANNSSASNTSSQTPTTSTPLNNSSSNANHTPLSSTMSTSQSTTTALAALNNNDLTLDMSIHISPAHLALGAAAASTSTTSNPYNRGLVNVDSAASSTVSVPPSTPLYHPHHPQNHHHHHHHSSHYLGLLQSSLHQSSESYHHYYQYSSKFTASSSAAAAAAAAAAAVGTSTSSTSSASQQTGSESGAIRPYPTSYNNSSNNFQASDNLGSWGRNGGSSHHHSTPYANNPHNYPSSYVSQMMINAHCSSGSGSSTSAYPGGHYPSESLSTSESTTADPLAYPPTHPLSAHQHHHLTGYSQPANLGYSPVAHQDSVGGPSPFIAVAAAAAVRSYQESMIGGHPTHPHHHQESASTKSDQTNSTLLTSNSANSSSSQAASLYLQH